MRDPADPQRETCNVTKVLPTSKLAKLLALHVAVPVR